MDEIRQKYAKLKNISLDKVPSVIFIEGKKELEEIVGPHKFESICKGTKEQLLDFKKNNGHIDCTIRIHYARDTNAYQGIFFSMDADHNQLEDTLNKYIPKNGEFEIDFKGTSKEIAEQLKNYINLSKEKKSRAYLDSIYPEGEYTNIRTTLKNKHGLHVQPISEIFKIAGQYGKKQEDIKLEYQGQEAEGIIGMMALGISYGKLITLKIRGADKNTMNAANEIYSLIENKFGEK